MQNSFNIGPKLLSLGRRVGIRPTKEGREYYDNTAEFLRNGVSIGPRNRFQYVLGGINSPIPFQCGIGRNNSLYQMVQGRINSHISFQCVIGRINSSYQNVLLRMNSAYQLVLGTINSQYQLCPRKN